MTPLEGNKHNELQLALKEMRERGDYPYTEQAFEFKHGYILLLVIILCLAAVVIGFWLGIASHYSWATWG